MQRHGQHSTKGSYGTWALTLAVNFVVMYLVMYTMIATLDHFYLNLGNVYMTAMMVAPMALVMLVSMRSMFPSPGANALVAIAAVAIFLLAFYGMRSQALIGDEQFLRSMIPHHSGAILMCERSALTDPEIRALCDTIVQSQREEIAQMRSLLERR
ncbi:MAG TPA: DUF305 domain-containing protein [Zeimonas sp.]